MLRNDAVRRELRGIAIALLLVAATTLVAFVLIRYLEVRRGSVIYLLPVLLAGWHLGLLPALVAAVAGVLWSGYFFFSPYYSYYLARPNEILNLVLFMVVAVVTSHLANSMKQQTELARKRENEMSDLYAFSRRLAAAPSAADIYRAIEEHLANLVRRKVVLFGAGSAATAHARPTRRRCRSACAPPSRDVQSGSTSRTTIDDGTGNIWLVRRVSQNDRRLRRHRHRPRQRAGRRHRRHPPAGRRRAVRRRRHARAPRCRARAQRRQDALRDRAAARGADRLGLARVAHAARLDPRRRHGADASRRRSPRTSGSTSLAGVVRDEAERLNNDIQNLLDATRISRRAGQAAAWNGSSRRTSSIPRSSAAGGGSPAISVVARHGLRICRSIYVDPVLVEQAFVQIVDNAAKYSPTGSPITVAAKRNGHDVVLSVHDSGAGLTGGGERRSSASASSAARAMPPRPPARASACGSPRPSSAPTAARSRPRARAPTRAPPSRSTCRSPTPASQPEVGPDD